MKFKDLKVGDTVVIFSDSSRYSPVERKVVKIGREYIHVESYYGTNNTSKFNLMTGSGEYGFHICCGTLNDYEIWKEENELWGKLRKRISNSYGMHLTKDQINRIEHILDE